MVRFFGSIVVAAVLTLLISLQVTALPGLPPIPEQPMADTVYVDNFNRPGPGLGPAWTADPEYEILSNELTNVDSVEALDDLAVFDPRINPIGVSFRWSASVDTSGMQRTGHALRLDSPSTSANGYFLFKNFTNNWYALWTVENGVVTSQVARSPVSQLPYFVPGDVFQVALSSNAQGHHFDIYVNDEFDVRLTDPNKVQGNADSLYSGVILDGGHDNNIDDYTFWRYSGDVTAPSPVGDLQVDSSTPTSITLTWTAPGDDDTTGTASRYDIRYSTSQINESNFNNATQVIGEPQPSPYGTQEFFTITGLTPDTEYWFALKSDDGFPQRNISAISNTPSGSTDDNIAPAAVADLSVTKVNSHTVLLEWTASGDNDNEGQATSYDIRFSMSPINESNFGSATRYVGEPAPQPAGEAELYTAGGLLPDTTYYFAMKVIDEANNASPLSNVPFTTTVVRPAVLDDFKRVGLGPDWAADPEFVIENFELSNEALAGGWEYMAVYVPATNVEACSYRWGVNADSMGMGEGGMALMLDSTSPDASGYLLFRHRTNNYYALWTIVDGAPDMVVAQSPVSSLPDPAPGDVFKVAVSSDIHGHHFDCYYNDVYDTRVSDPGKLQGNATDWYSGVMLHANRNNNVDDWWVMGPGANIPPGTFSLLSPANGSTVETGTPLLDWEDSIDPNLSDSVLYQLQYGTSAVFAPESTIIIDDLPTSEYAIPPMSILSLVRNHGFTASGVASSAVTDHISVVSTLTDGTVISKASGGYDETRPSSLPDDVVIYWKVKAFDRGSLETWSNETDWSFLVSIPEPPLPFSLLSPEDGDTVDTLTPTLIWEATSDPDPGDVIRYTLYYDVEAGFPDPVIVPDLDVTTYETPALQDETTYYWKVEAIDSKDLVTESTETFSFYVWLSSGIGDGGGSMPVLPKVYALGQNYPNPFNPSTSIRFDIPEDASSGEGSQVLLQVFNIRGQLVRILVDDVMAPGSYAVHWDGSNDQGERAGSGIFLYRIQAGNFHATKKMVILK